MSEFSLENLMCHRDNLEHVLDNLKEGIIAHDMSRRIFFFNQEAERISGYQRKDVLGLDCPRNWFWFRRSLDSVFDRCWIIGSGLEQPYWTLDSHQSPTKTRRKTRKDRYQFSDPKSFFCLESQDLQ